MALNTQSGQRAGKYTFERVDSRLSHTKFRHGILDHVERKSSWWWLDGSSNKNDAVSFGGLGNATNCQQVQSWRGIRRSRRIVGRQGNTQIRSIARRAPRGQAPRSPICSRRAECRGAQGASARAVLRTAMV
jgi:hypothetical protein